MYGMASSFINVPENRSIIDHRGQAQFYIHIYFGPDACVCGIVTVFGGKLGGRADAGAAGTETPACRWSVWRSKAEC